mgnify:CR=1 FL=1
MMIEISVQNGISKYLQSLIRNSPDFVRGCSKSMGYFVQREIKSELRKGGGDFKSSWPKRIPWRVRNDLRPGAPQKMVWAVNKCNRISVCIRRACEGRLDVSGIC